MTRSAPRGAFAALFTGGAAAAIAESAALFVTAGTSRPYLLPLGAAALLVALALVAIVALLASRLLARWSQPKVDAAPRLVAAAAHALATGLTAAFVALNELSPLAAAAPGGRSWVLLAALAGAGAVAAVRLRLPRPRSFLLLEAPLVAAAVTTAYTLLWLRGRALLSPAGLGLVLGAALVTLVVSRPLERRLAGRGAQAASALAAALAATALLGCGLGLVLGRRPFPACTARSAAGPPDVLLVVLDTTRADHAPAPPGSRRPTAALDRLAREGRRHAHVFSTSCWTLPAHGSLFTGLLPSAHGATWASERLPPGPATLAERFSRAGFRTAAFSANPWIGRELGFDRGFERFVEENAGRRPLRPWATLLFAGRAEASGAALALADKGGVTLVSEALRFLAEPDPRPAFVFVNLMEPHLPYAPPPAVLGELAGTGFSIAELAALDQDRLRDLRPGAERSQRDIEGLRLLYAAEIAYADRLLGRLLERLDAASRLDRTVVAVTSDHGENLGDHPPLDHQLGLWDTLLHVPLVVRYPEQVPAGAVEESMLSLADLPGLLLGIVGIGGDGGGERVANDAVLFEYDRPTHILTLLEERLGIDPSPWDRTLAGIRTLDRKWIRASDGRNQAFDLAADPGERHNLASAKGEVPPGFEPLAADLERALGAGAGTAAAPTPLLSEEAAERLRSLGYVR